MAEDSDAGVRLAVANNLSAPRKADVLLAKGDDVSVRGDLAVKIACLAPGLSAKIAKTLQNELALIPPTEMIRAEGGRYTLEESDMKWQLDFIKDLG